MKLQGMTEAEKDRLIERLKVAFFDAVRFIPTTERIELNADTIQLTAELMDEEKATAEAALEAKNRQRTHAETCGWRLYGPPAVCTCQR